MLKEHRSHLQDLCKHLSTSLQHHLKHLRLLGQRAGVGAWMVVALERPWRTWQSIGRGLCHRAWMMKCTGALLATPITPSSSCSGT